MIARSHHGQLLEQARLLATKEKGRPLQVSLRRSASAAYYALFHFLIDATTKSWLGARPSQRTMRQILARAFQPGTMLQASRGFCSGALGRGMQSVGTAMTVPAELHYLATTFIELQDLRHRADYDLAASFSRQEVLGKVVRVEKAIQDWRAIEDHPLSRFYLVSLLTWDRLRDR